MPFGCSFCRGKLKFSAVWNIVPLRLLYNINRLLYYRTALSSHDTCHELCDSDDTMHRQRARARGRAPGLEQALIFYLLPTFYLTSGREDPRLRSTAWLVKQHSPIVYIAICAVVRTCNSNNTNSHISLLVSYIESHFSADAALLFQLYIQQY